MLRLPSAANSYVIYNRIARQLFQIPSGRTRMGCPQPFVRSRSSDDPSVETACVPAPESGPCVPSRPRVRRASRVPHARATESPSSRHRSGLRPRRRRWNRCGRRLYRHGIVEVLFAYDLRAARGAVVDAYDHGFAGKHRRIVRRIVHGSHRMRVRAVIHDLRIGARTGDIGLVRGVIREAGRTRRSGRAGILTQQRVHGDGARCVA